VIELVNPNDARAVRNKDNVLALYDLMINKKEAEQAVAKFFAPKYIQHNPLVPDGAAELAGFFDKMAKNRANLRIGGLAGGWLYRWRPKLAQHPPTGFCLTLGVSLLRSGLIFLYAPHSRTALHRFDEIGMAPVLQGLGTALPN
jgi:hypothetical protein